MLLPLVSLHHIWFFLANVSHIQELVSYKQASVNADWVAAMDKELHALEENNT